MLSHDDEQTIEAVLNEFARRGQTGAAETAALLARLPSRPDVLEHFVGRAKTRGLPWVEYLARTMMALGKPPAYTATPAAAAPAPAMPVTGAQLTAVLASSEPYPRKVEALLAALRAKHPELAGVVRKHLPHETDPFVLATLASALGQCGTPLDGALLAPLLSHADARVVANALDSMRRLRAPPRAEVMVRLLESPDNRVRTNAIAFLGVLDPERALWLVRALVVSPEPTTRAGIAYVLGELAAQDGATELLLDMNEREQNMVVLKQIAQSLKKHSSPGRTPQMVGPLAAAAEAATGAKRSMIATTLHEIAVESGLVQADVQRLVSEHRHVSEQSAKSEVAPRTVTPVPIAPVARPATATTTAAFTRTPLPPVPVSPGAGATTTQAFRFVPTPTVEGDEDLSFSNVWGAPQPPAAATSTGALKLPRARSGATPAPSRATLLPVADAPPARSGAWLWLGGGIAALALVGGMVASGSHAAPETAASAASPRAIAHPKKGRNLPAAPALRTARGTVPPNPIAAHLGPAGASVRVQGTVVGISSGKPVIEHNGQYYLVVKPAHPIEDLKRGALMHVAGRIMGTSGDGLFYLEEAP